MNAEYRLVLTDDRKTAIVVWRSGRILVSARLSRVLHLTEGDSINILTDGEEHYVVRVARQHGERKAVLRKTNRKSRGGSLFLYSKTLARHLLRVSDSTDKVRLAAGEPTKIDSFTVAVPLITRNPIR